jgi:hypothetical protein
MEGGDHGSYLPVGSARPSRQGGGGGEWLESSKLVLDNLTGEADTWKMWYFAYIAYITQHWHTFINWHTCIHTHNNFGHGGGLHTLFPVFENILPVACNITINVCFHRKTYMIDRYKQARGVPP